MSTQLECYLAKKKVAIDRHYNIAVSQDIQVKEIGYKIIY